MEFKVGDKVKDEVFGEGKVVETNNKEILVQFKKANDILHNGSLGINGPYEENTCYWFLKNTTNLKKIKDYTYEELKKSPIGTKVTFENGEKLIKSSENRYENENKWREEDDLVKMKDESGTLGKIIKIEEPEYTTVYEYKPEILDKVEKRCLKQVIRPYKDVISIRKCSCVDCSLAKIVISVPYTEGHNLLSIELPPFKKNIMYKNMEPNKDYTLTELGLKE